MVVFQDDRHVYVTSSSDDTANVDDVDGENKFSLRRTYSLNGITLLPPPHIYTLNSVFPLNQSLNVDGAHPNRELFADAENSCSC